MKETQPTAITPQPKQNFWSQQIENWKQSGLSQVQYCLEHNLKKHTFYYWRAKLDQDCEPQPLLPVTIIPDSPPVSYSNTSGISLSIGGRFIIQLEEGFSGTALSKLIDILEER